MSREVFETLAILKHNLGAEGRKGLKHLLIPRQNEENEKDDIALDVIHD